MIRLIVTDMDGTLLHDDKSMPDGTFALIDALHARGIHFAAASGRQYASLRDNFKEHATYMHFIAENGAVSADGATDTILRTHPLPLDKAIELIRIARSLPDTFVVACGAQAAYYESDSPILERNLAAYYHRRMLVKDLTALNEELVKLAILNIHGTQEFVHPHFAPYKEQFSIAVSAFEWMDIMMPNVHKGVGVRDLQQRLGVSRDETMAFGDFMNDYELLQEAAYSFAMKNAIPAIKEVATYETAFTNEEDGVIKEIRRWLQI